MNNFELISFANADELARAAAGAWLDEIESAHRAGITHSVALSGGRITQRFFAETVKRAGARKISFERVHFFWADERCVPPEDPESNFKMARELLFAPLKISEKQIHRIRGELSPQTAAKSAETEFRQAALQQKKEPVLDLILLGMGEDGHVASLFPGRSEGTDPGEIFCVVNNSPKPPPDRISLSYTAIAAAKNVWVLASGAGKEKAFRDSLSSEGATPLATVIQMRMQMKVLSDILK